MAGIDWLSAILGGVGQGIGAAGNVIAKGREEALEREKVAASERRHAETLAETKRQFDEGRTTDLDSLVQMGVFPPAIAGRLRAGGGRVPTALLAPLLAAGEKEEARGREAVAGQQLGGIMREAASAETEAVTPRFRSKEEGSGMTTGPRPDPLAYLGHVIGIPGLSKEQTGLAQDYFKSRVESRKPQLVPETTAGIIRDDKYEPLDSPSGQPSPPNYDPTKQQGTTTYDRRGRPSYSVRDIGPSIDKDMLAEAYRLHPDDAGARAAYIDKRKATQAGATQEAKTFADRNEFLTPSQAASIGVKYGITKGEAAALNKIPLTAYQQNRAEALRGSVAILNNFEKDVDKLFTAGGMMERLYQIPKQSWDVYLQNNPEAAVYQDAKDGVLAMFVRAFGDVGTLNEGDIKRARKLTPDLAPIPDTRAVALGKIAKLRDLFNEISARPVPAQGAGQPNPSAPAPAAPAPGATRERTYNRATGRIE